MKQIAVLMKTCFLKMTDRISDISNRARPLLIVIAGPTAVGKTALSIQLAKELNTSIISADSRQCYHELNIGVARPTAEELAEVPHYFIASHSIHNNLTAADFVKYAEEKLCSIWSISPYAVLVGGTGLYIQALVDGLDDIPATPPELREHMNHLFELEGIKGLQKIIQLKDPLFYSEGEIDNPRRVMRALEVIELTGKSIIDWQSGQLKVRNFDVLEYGLNMPRELLYDRINHRVLQMMKMGLKKEALELFPYRSQTALQTVGYQEWYEGIDMGWDDSKVIETIQQKTRHYAKRQITWFKKRVHLKWLDASSPSVKNEILNEVYSRGL